MKVKAIKRPAAVYLALALFWLAAAYSAIPRTQAAPIPAQMQAKVDKYKEKLAKWAGDPVIVSAVKAANAKGPLPGMSNSKWIELGDKDPVVTAFQTSPAGKLVTQWEADKNLGKLNVRDDKGNLVAASSSAKPLLYNNGTKPPFVNGIKGEPWAASQMKPDPTTQRNSVQIAAPVLDNGKPIGVIHSAVQVQ